MLFVLYTCVLFAKVKDFVLAVWAEPVEEFEEFFDAFANMSLEEACLGAGPSEPGAPPTSLSIPPAHAAPPPLPCRAPFAHVA
jgi:hypothetical protein